MTHADKETRRSQLRATLHALEPETARQKSEEIEGLVLALPEVANAKTVLTCLSFGAEVETRGIIDTCLDRGQQVLVPRAEPRDKSLHVHPFPCPLRTLSFGLQQPPRGTPEISPESFDDTIDVVLVLGLGFDHQGYRLGYGGGYFDRFLTNRLFPAVGLAFDCQIVDSLPVEPHDVPMARVVTESGVRRAPDP